MSAMTVDGTQSMPSLNSDIIRLNGLQANHYAELNNLNGTSQLQHGQPERPAPCEYLDFDGGNSVTLCWLPAKSVLPVLASQIYLTKCNVTQFQGYRVEFRDLQQDPKSWYEVTGACLPLWKDVNNSVVNSDFTVNQDSLSVHQTESVIAKNFIHKCD